jgi:hypothetical protein
MKPTAAAAVDRFRSVAREPGRRRFLASISNDRLKTNFPSIIQRRASLCQTVTYYFSQTSIFKLFLVFEQTGQVRSLVVLLRTICGVGRRLNSTMSAVTGSL